VKQQAERVYVRTGPKALVRMVEHGIGYDDAKAMQGKELYAERRTTGSWDVYFAPNDYWVVPAECVELADPFRKALAEYKTGKGESGV
jgi:hypothetical protein